ncbi:MAG TPA: alpha/beta fold hydrolase [Candidatus Acidoferrales bacterium]|nr:alpha/beta fold hydrolase [Candidatus Acidoferrales bacterium]
MRLHFAAEGTGYPLIILHGLLGSCENWRAQRKFFARSYRVFAVDLRNHGHSPHSEVFTFAAMAEDLKEFLEDQALESVHLLGHSLGGKVAMQFATSWPESVAKLVIVDIAPKSYPGEHLEILAAMESLDLSALRSRAQAEAALAATVPALSMRRFLLKNLEYRDQKLRWRINLPALRRNYPAILAALPLDRQFDKPALFVKGERSRSIEPKDEEQIRRFFPRAEIVTLAGAGHWVHSDNPEAFQQAVLSFLRRE